MLFDAFGLLLPWRTRRRHRANRDPNLFGLGLGPENHCECRTSIASKPAEYDGVVRIILVHPFLTMTTALPYEFNQPQTSLGLFITSKIAVELQRIHHKDCPHETTLSSLPCSFLKLWHTSKTNEFFNAEP